MESLCLPAGAPIQVLAMRFRRFQKALVVSMKAPTLPGVLWMSLECLTSLPFLG